MQVLALLLAEAAIDQQAAEGLGLTAGLQQWVGSLGGRKGPDGDTARAMDVLEKRFHDRVRQATNKLIALHGLSGNANAAIAARVPEQFRVADAAPIGTSGTLGAVAAGALTGLTADLAAGGLTFGAGAVIGGILGALGGAGVAHAYNIAKGAEQGSVRWSREWLSRRPKAALLCYLAVAHYGRGRGEWLEGEYPAHWQPMADTLTARYAPDLDPVWDVAERDASRDQVATLLQPIITAMTRDALIRLYPDASAIFSDSERASPENPQSQVPAVRR
jgi:hypothetical protein